MTVMMLKNGKGYYTAPQAPARRDGEKDLCGHPGRCDHAVYSNGWCNMHIIRIRKKGSPGPAGQMPRHGRKPIHPDVVNRVTRNLELRPREPYPGNAHKPWSLDCLRCGQPVTTTFYSIKHSIHRGCKSCQLQARQGITARYI